jgi:hypothetical protein
VGLLCQLIPKIRTLACAGDEDRLGRALPPRRASGPSRASALTRSGGRVPPVSATTSPLGLELLGLALYAEYAVNFTLAFVLGIALQYFSIKPMRDLGRRDGVVAALKADTLSLVTFEVGDFARMAVVQLVHRPALARGHGRVLVPDADRDDPRLRDVPPGQCLADQPRDQGSDVTNAARLHQGVC